MVFDQETIIIGWEDWLYKNQAYISPLVMGFDLEAMVFGWDIGYMCIKSCNALLGHGF